MTVLTAKSVREVAAWIKVWRPDEPVNVVVTPEPTITVYRPRGVLVYGADSIRRLALGG